MWEAMGFDVTICWLNYCNLSSYFKYGFCTPVLLRVTELKRVSPYFNKNFTPLSLSVTRGLQVHWNMELKDIFILLYAKLKCMHSSEHHNKNLMTKGDVWSWWGDSKRFNIHCVYWIPSQTESMSIWDTWTCFMPWLKLRKMHHCSVLFFCLTYSATVYTELFNLCTLPEYPGYNRSSKHFIPSLSVLA